MFNITIKGRTFKVSGLPIKRVPEGKVCVMSDFHIINYDNTDTCVFEKYGEISLVPNDSYDKDIVLDIRNCKFECK